jgi:hypothetical protein
MNVLILSSSRSDQYASFELACGNQKARVNFGPNGVGALCLNASNRAWGGLGRSFPDVASALAAYKSSAMRSMIRAAADQLVSDNSAAKEAA